MMLEVRNETEHQVSFALLDLQKRMVLQHEILLPEAWWISMSAITDRFLICSYYENAQDPNSQQVWIYDYIDHKLIQQLEGYQLSGLHDKRYLELSLMQPTRRTNYFDLKTLSMTKTYPELNTDPRSLAQVVLPNHYTDGSLHFETVRAFCQERLDCHILGGCDYLEWENLILMSYFWKPEEQLENNLVVLDQDFSIIFEEQLGTDLKGIGEETFFLFEHELFFIRHKHECWSVKL
jgi:hypothetical protein